jgi:hypothetical protein
MFTIHFTVISLSRQIVPEGGYFERASGSCLESGPDQEGQLR